jgi:hypothetical protein
MTRRSTARVVACAAKALDREAIKPAAHPDAEARRNDRRSIMPLIGAALLGDAAVLAAC